MFPHQNQVYQNLNRANALFMQNLFRHHQDDENPALPPSGAKGYTMEVYNPEDFYDDVHANDSFEFEDEFDPDGDQEEEKSKMNPKKVGETSKKSAPLTTPKIFPWTADLENAFMNQVLIKLDYLFPQVGSLYVKKLCITKGYDDIKAFMLGNLGKLFIQFIPG